MNAAATLTLVSAVVAIVVGVRSHRLALTPGSQAQRGFTVVVLASAAYALLNLATTLPAAPRVVSALAGAEISVLTVLLWGWLRFAREVTGIRPGRAERLASVALLAAAPVMAFPGLLFTRSIVELPFPFLGVVYRQGTTTRVGDGVLTLLLLVAAAVLVRFVRAARRGVRHAGLISAGYATMLAFAVWDAVAVSLALPGVPFVLDWGFGPAVLAVGWTNTSRLIEDARALEELRAGLAVQVSLRTRELSSALERLHESEKLVSLGRFANGVAHQVNNPAAVVASSLGFLAERAGPRLAPAEAEALADARAATDRITFLVRRLVDAAQIAEAPSARGVADVLAAISAVVGRQAAPRRDAVVVRADGALDACVAMRPDALEAVLETLVGNALAAARGEGRGRVDLRVERAAGRIRIVVANPGAALTPEALGRAFDPFFSTAAPGSGGVVGLAVARGLAQANGGALSLESAPGGGMRAILELPEERLAPARGARAS